MSFARAAGILLHPTSLPSRGGIGDFGPAAYRFVDFLASARQGVWQVLPLGPLGYGNSPYSSTSAFAGNPVLISLERLVDHGWIDRGQLDQLPTGSGAVEYDRVFVQKMPLLFEAAHRFLKSASQKGLQRFESFRSSNAWWLDDFVLFDALRARHKLVLFFSTLCAHATSWNPGTAGPGHWPRANRQLWKEPGKIWPMTSEYAALFSLPSTSSGVRCGHIAPNDRSASSAMWRFS
jgi:4-alpha-glucanotransferase